MPTCLSEQHATVCEYQYTVLMNVRVGWCLPWTVLLETMCFRHNIIFNSQFLWFYMCARAIIVLLILLLS